MTITTKKPRLEPILDMNRLAEQISTTNYTGGPTDYAPPAIREEQAPTVVEQVLTFSELPTKALDETVASLEAEVAEVKAKMQAIRDLYVKHTKRVSDDIERLRACGRLAKKTVEDLHEQCLQLDIAAIVAEVPKEPTQ